METKSNFFKASVLLGILAFVLQILSMMALQDIFQNKEPDLSMEWKIVQACFLVTMAFIVISMITFMKFIEK